MNVLMGGSGHARGGFCANDSGQGRPGPWDGGAGNGGTCYSSGATLQMTGTNAAGGRMARRVAGQLIGRESHWGPSEDRKKKGMRCLPGGYSSVKVLVSSQVFCGQAERTAPIWFPLVHPAASAAKSGKQF